MELREHLQDLRHFLSRPGTIETLVAVFICTVDLILVDHEIPLALVLLLDAVRILLVAFTAFLPYIGAAVVPAVYLALAFVPSQQPPLQIFGALLIVQLLRASGHPVLARVSGAALLFISLYDTASGNFAADPVATVVTTVLFLLFYGLGSLRHNYQQQGVRSRRAARAAMHRQRLELARVLHDSIAKSFTRVTMHSQTLAIEWEDDNEELATQLEDIAEVSREGLLQLRQLLALLKAENELDDDDAEMPSLPHALGGTQVVPTVDRVLHQAEQELTDSGFQVNVGSRIESPPSLSQVSEVIAPAFSEICMNIEKYAQPGSVVRILANGSPDDGYTFCISNTIAAESPRGLSRTMLSSGLGLTNLRRRIHSLSGSIDTEKDGNQWTTTIRLPGRRTENSLLADSHD